MSQTATRTVPAPAEPAPFAAFIGHVSALTAIGRSLVRVTCQGDDFRRMADPGFDQRIKLILPLPETGYETFPTGPDWYDHWRHLDESEQNPLRTYTTRAVRSELGEVDIDMVLHGDGGPASAWVAKVQIGDPVALLGPNAEFSGDPGGLEFQLPSEDSLILLAGDETAQPAIATILEQLPAGVTGKVILEMPYAEDVIDLIKPDGIEIEWLIRGDRPVGEPMLESFRQHAVDLFQVGSTDSADSATEIPNEAEPDEAEPDEEVLWDVPAARIDRGVYAWIAGEAAMVRAMRRLLVSDLGIDKNSVAFMGYWRLS